MWFQVVDAWPREIGSVAWHGFCFDCNYATVGDSITYLVAGISIPSRMLTGYFLARTYFVQHLRPLEGIQVCTRTCSVH